MVSIFCHLDLGMTCKKFITATIIIHSFIHSCTKEYITHDEHVTQHTPQWRFMCSDLQNIINITTKPLIDNIYHLGINSFISQMLLYIYSIYTHRMDICVLVFLKENLPLGMHEFAHNINIRCVPLGFTERPSENLQDQIARRTLNRCIWRLYVDI